MTSVFGTVMERLSAGQSPRSVARELGISVDLAQAVAAEAGRLGLTVTADAACGTCATPRSLACAGCPMASRGPASG